MAQHYSNPKRADDPHALPDFETFQLTAAEVAEGMEDEIFEAMRMPQFRLANMNGKVREAMLDYIVAEHGVEGGWFYAWLDGGLDCFSSLPIGPFATQAEAVAAAKLEASEGME